MKTICILAAAIFAIAGSLQARDSVGERMVDGATNAAVISQPDSIKAWRTVGSLNPKESKTEEFYQKSGKAVIVSPAAAAHLAKVLLDKGTYYAPGEDPNGGQADKRCLPRPGYVVEFVKGNRTLNLYFCFECKILLIKPGRDRVNFDAGSPRLLKALDLCFASDTSGAKDK